MDSKNTIYQQLAMIPSEIADKITNAKTGGGRSLNAIHESKTLNHMEKHLMLILASEMNYTMSFENQYRFISLNSLADKMSVDRRTISSILNGTIRKGNAVPGLIEKGYILKQIVSAEEQRKSYANHYCLTSKIFNEYMLGMIQKHQPSDLGSLGYGSTITRGSDRGSHKYPVLNTPVLDPSNAAVQQRATAVKRCRPPAKSKMKTWDEKSDEEKRETIFNKAFEAHLSAVKRRIARPFPRDDIPDLITPITTGYGLDKVKIFFENLDEKGIDVRVVAKKMAETDANLQITTIVNETSISAGTISEQEEKINRANENLGVEILNQLEENMMYANNLSKVDTELVKIEDFPIRLKKFYDSINSKIQKNSMLREIAVMGIDKYLELRATAILRCSYDELFVEKQSIFAEF